MTTARSDSKVVFNVDILIEFIGANLSVCKVQGNEVLGFCPFCQGGETNEVSFALNVEKGVALCRRATKCAWSGTVFNLVADVMGWSTQEAKAYLQGGEINSMDEIIGLMNRSMRYVRPKLSFVKEETDGIISAMPYDARSLSRIYDDVAKWLRDVRGYEPESFMARHELFESNLQLFQGRVLFGVYSGEHSAYQAYAYIPQERKTLNPPGSVLSQMLFNYDEAKDGGTIFVTEGIFDAARLVERGFYAVCVFGTNLSIPQAFLLGDTKAEEIAVCFDHGTTKKAKRAAETLGRFTSKTVSIMSLDVPGSDPDTLPEKDFLRAYRNRVCLVRPQDKMRAALDQLA